MYTSYDSEVYNYTGVKPTHGRYTTKVCLLMPSEAQVGLCKCVTFYVPHNPRVNLPLHSRVFSTSDVEWLYDTDMKEIQSLASIYLMGKQLYIF